MDKHVETVLRGGRFKKMVASQFYDIGEKYDLKRVEMEILIFTSRCGEKNTLKDIAQYLEMNKGHISQAIDRLCKKGYLVAKPDDYDRRYVHYFVTEKGESFKREMLVLWDKMIEKIFEGITEEQMQIFQEVTYRINKNMDRILDEA